MSPWWLVLQGHFTLGDLAESYIAALDESLASLSSYDTNYPDYAERWDKAYDAGFDHIATTWGKWWATWPN